MSRWLCLVFLLGCNVPQDIMLRPAGLWTSPNKYDAPPGSLSKANNARIVRPGLIEQRRGWAIYDNALISLVGSLGVYDGGGGPKIVDQYGTTISRNYVPYAGTNAPPSTWAFLSPPTRFVELLRRLYATTDVGVRRFEYGRGAFTFDAGVSWAPDISTSTAATGASGFLANGASATYRVAWGYTDSNGFLVLGAPSGPFTVTNSSGTAANVNVVFIAPPILPPAGSLTYYLYRSATVTGTPSDDVFLTYQSTFSGSAGAVVTVTDSTPDAILGPPLYTNSTQEGALAANFQPPYASDIVYAFNKLFFLQTKARDAVQFDMLSTSNIRVGDILTLGAQTFSADASTTSATGFKLVTGGTASADIAATAQNIVEACNRAFSLFSPSLLVAAHYISGPSDAPGQIWVEHVNFTSTPIATPVFTAHAAFINIGGLTRSGSTVTATTTAPHNLSTGDLVTVTCTDPNYATGTRAVTVTGGTTFTYTLAGTTTASLNIATAVRTNNLPSADFVVDATPQTRAYKKNGLAWSKDGEFEAVPETNYATIGSMDAAMLRGIALRDSLFLFKEDGLWRANDDGQGGIFITLVDPTVKLVAPRSAVVLAGSILAWTTKGVVPINESGVGPPISDAIDFDLRSDITKAAADSGDPTNANFRSRTWAVAYEEEGLYLLTVMDENEPDTLKTYVYSIKSKAWTKDNKASLSCGFVNPADGLLYVGTSTGNVLVERKTLTATDYKDEDNSAIAFDVKWNPAGNPFTNKRFAEAQFLLQDSTATTVTANFSTDQQTTDQTVSIAIDASYANGPIRTQIPLEAAQGTTIAPGIAHAVAGEKIMIAGVMVDIADGSGRTRK